MGLIQLNLTKKVLSFFLIFFLLNACAHALDFELASNYEKIKTAVFNKDPQKIFEIKSDIGIIHPLKKAKLEAEEIVTLFRKVGIDERSITFLQKTWPENNSLGHFVGFLFYPHTNLIETIATNFTQLPKALKASILIAAEYGFKPARNLLVITSLGKARIKEISFSSEDELISFLSIPFCCEDISVMEAAKTLLESDNRRNVASFITKSHVSENPMILLNSAHILKVLGLSGEAFSILDHAIALGSKRAVIEKGFLLREQNFMAAQGFFESGEVAGHSLGTYGLWKIAQCYRYAIGTKRNLPAANIFYLRALNMPRSDTSQLVFPEIHYDAGEFATYYALSQSEPAKKISALRQALRHFQTAMEYGMAPAFLKAAETERQLGELEASGLGEIFEIAVRAARNGLFDEASTIANRYGLPIPKGTETDAFIWAQAQQLSQEYEKIEDKVKEW